MHFLSIFLIALIVWAIVGFFVALMIFLDEDSRCWRWSWKQMTFFAMMCGPVVCFLGGVAMTFHGLIEGLFRLTEWIGRLQMWKKATTKFNQFWDSLA